MKKADMISAMIEKATHSYYLYQMDRHALALSLLAIANNTSLEEFNAACKQNLPLNSKWVYWQATAEMCTSAGVVWCATDKATAAASWYIEKAQAYERKTLALFIGK